MFLLNVFSVFKINTKCLAPDILLSLVTVIIPHPRWRPAEVPLWKICFPFSFIVSVWLENQTALAKENVYVQPFFLFLGVHR